MRHVEALDPLRRRRQLERLLQGGEALVLCRLLRNLLPDRELRILHRHRHPDASLASGIGHDLDRPTGLRGEHFREELAVRRVKRNDRRRRGQLEVMLHKESRDDF